MSNTVVGQVYNRIIDAVIEASRTDFEEYGASNQGLQMLREKWQERLSGTHRALFPWDPQPPPSAPEPPTVPSNAVKQEPAPPMSSAAAPTASPDSAQQPGNVPVKQEPYDTSFLNLPQTTPYNSSVNPQYASERAQHLLQQRYGTQAQGSISAIQAHGGSSMTGVQPRQNGQPTPANAQPQQAEAPAEQQSHAQAHAQAQQPSASPRVKQEAQSGLGYSQTDGAGDDAEVWQTVIADRNAIGEQTAREADRMIRRQVEEMGQRLEAGGLMLPLDERRVPVSKKRKLKERTSRVTASTDSMSTDVQPYIPGDQYDGPVDDSSPRDEDEDPADDEAINSDLDDPEEDLETGIETAYDGDVILCLYDKVQRVKNKWKCTLKDGVVTVGGKDYVFHKANGEFEW